MKKLIFFITIFLTFALYSQNSYETATLKLRNGEEKQGEAKILLGDLRIKFKSKNGEKEEYNYRKVKELKIVKEGDTSVYKYKIIVGNKPKLMKVIKEYPNKINLYGVSYSVTFGYGISITDNFDDYYVNKGSGDVVIKLGSSQQVYGSRQFKKTTLKFFKDCPSLIRKIKNKEFNRRKHMEEIIEYYKNECE